MYHKISVEYTVLQMCTAVNLHQYKVSYIWVGTFAFRNWPLFYLLTIGPIQLNGFAYIYAHVSQLYNLTKGVNFLGDNWLLPKKKKIFFFLSSGVLNYNIDSPVYI